MTRDLPEGRAQAGAERKNAFRMRGGEISRIEGFSDAVFAFAVTLLVVSLEVPRTFAELTAAMKGFVVFAVCFTFLIEVWREHYVFFRRYGLRDAGTLWLNAGLLFVVLFYVYPLKFLFNVVFSGLTGAPREVPGPDGRMEAVIENAQVPSLFLIYGSGVIALYLLLALLYAHALRQRASLQLTPVELFDTRSSIARHLLAAGVAAVSCIVALTVPPKLVGLAGYAYFLLGPAMAIHGARAGRQRRRLEVRAAL